MSLRATRIRSNGFINAACAVLTAAVILLFCLSCTVEQNLAENGVSAECMTEYYIYSMIRYGEYDLDADDYIEKPYDIDVCKRVMSLMGGEVFADIRSGCFFVTLVVKLA